MRMTSRGNINGKVVILTEEKYCLFWKKKKRFEAQREICPGYWEWLELPDRILVDDRQSFQLDAWRKTL